MANKVWPENAMLQCLYLECDTKKNPDFWVGKSSSNL